jgi:hypothetical protein
MEEGWNFPHLGHDREATHGGILPHPAVGGKGGSECYRSTGRIPKVSLFYENQI